MEKIVTKAYGEIEVPENSAIDFVGPILGFEDYHNYYLLEIQDLPGFYWLQSKEETNVAFIVINPRMFMSGYELKIDESDMKQLQIAEGDEVLDYVIVNIPEDPAKMTMNLLGPLVINATKRFGIQGISNINDYGTKALVFQVKETEETSDDKVSLNGSKA
ncbi:MAG: flagellar assembly protein FliW [Brevinematales bacterium]|nr:flagellar assembly protein FliW [Brevinematales bacterium]